MGYNGRGDESLEKILELLKAHQDSFVSGEELARIAGMTRAGIWKQIEGLREAGYIIESSTRKGYCLSSRSDALSPLEIRHNLPTRRFGQVVYCQHEVDSTNAWGRRLAETGAPEGTVLVAERQTLGRGRMGRSWSSIAGRGLSFSFILRPRLSAAELAVIMILTAVCMARAVERVTGIGLAIKWPNDLMHEGRKLTGILAEMKGEMDLVQYLVIGVGLNVNHELSDFPAELADRAGSLRMIAGKPFLRSALLREFLVEFEKAYDGIAAGSLAAVIADARAHSATLGRRVTINQGFGKILTGQAEDLDQDGSLWLRTDSGELLRVNSGELIADFKED
jgi:BirA family biotin operon repressor/biotin-[acetyl-CoA-carboxylase] ligase